MEFNGRRQHNRNHSSSSSSDRFLTVFTPPQQSSILTYGNGSDSASLADELNEDDVFWTGDFAQKKLNYTSSSKLWPFSKFSNRSPFLKPEEKSGILAALSEESKIQALRRKPSYSPTTARNSVLAIPRPPSEKELAKTAPADEPKFQFSAPVNVPVLSREMMKANARRNKAFFDVVDDDDEDGDDEMLPPHEIVARGSALTPNTTFSMLEGVGRTLKGRDLRQVRNAVFRQTGFLD